MSPGRPGIRVMIKNLAQTAKEVVYTAAEGNVLLASEETIQSRFNVCSECSLFSVKDTRCLQCGCFLKAKIRLQPAKCPIGKW